MSNQIGFTLTFARKVVLGTAIVATVMVPIAVGMLNEPAAHAQSAAQTVPASAKFAVASIKLAASNSGQFMFGVRPMPGGRISAVNVTLRMLIERAYGLQGFQLSGGPGWADTVRYNIEAKPDTPVGNEWREMLQNLLADRFHLAFPSRNQGASDLRAGAGEEGPSDGSGNGRIEGGRLHRTRSVEAARAAGPGQPPYCGNVLGGSGQLTGTAANVDDVAVMLSLSVGRKVIDKTGLTEKYDITQKYTPDENEGSVATVKSRASEMKTLSHLSSGEAEHGRNEAELPLDFTLADPFCLSLPDHVHCLVTSDRSPGAPK